MDRRLINLRINGSWREEWGEGEGSIFCVSVNKSELYDLL